MGFVEEMKWWQWVLLSIGVGALLGYLNSGGANPSVDHMSVSPMVFETGLMQAPYVDPAKPANPQPYVSNVVIYPPQQIVVAGRPQQVQLVIFSALNPYSPGHPSGSYERVSMFAPFPYEPQPRHEPSDDHQEWPAAALYEGQSGDTIQSLATRFYHKATPQGVNAIVAANEFLRGAKNAADLKINPGVQYWIPWNPADKHTFSDFLVAANATIRGEQGPNAIPISYRYVWWAAPNHAYAIWMTGSFLLIGVIWPTLLQIMVKGGFGRAKSDEFDLSRYKPSPVAAAAPKTATAVTTNDMQQLQEVQDSLEASLRASASTAGPAAQPQSQPAAPAIKVLAGSAAPAESPAVPQTPEEPKEYKGEFYPVVLPVHKKTD